MREAFGDHREKCVKAYTRGNSLLPTGHVPLVQRFSAFFALFDLRVVLSTGQKSVSTEDHMLERGGRYSLIATTSDAA